MSTPEELLNEHGTREHYQGRQRKANGEDRTHDADALPLVWFNEIKPSLVTADFVEGVLIDGGASVVYGESNTTKTHFATNLGLHVALGWEWHGRQVERGGVVYIAAEGRHGIMQRVAAFKARNPQIEGRIPFVVIPASIDLCKSDADTARLINAIQAVAETAGKPVRLVEIDTLSRAMAGGNENSPDDMGAYVRNIDAIRNATGAHVLSVHHSGKDRAQGARGHSLLRAAVDTEIEITRDAVSSIATAKLTKQRDLPLGDPISYRLDVVELGMNDRGKPVTSCVVVPVDESEAPRQPEAQHRMSDQNRRALEMLKRAVHEAGEPPVASNHIPRTARVVPENLWRQWCYQGAVTTADTQEARQKAFKRAADALIARGVVGKWGTHVWVA